jgi:hypothetical protein
LPNAKRPFLRISDKLLSYEDWAAYLLQSLLASSALFLNDDVSRTEFNGTKFEMA